MPSDLNTSVEPTNPYEPPKACCRLVPRRTRSVWVGPFLSCGSLALFLAFVNIGGVTVLPDHRSIQFLVAISLAVTGVVCLAVSFRLHRRARVRGRV
jgi:uncharacterized membrane-anchored protein